MNSPQLERGEKLAALLPDQISLHVLMALASAPERGSTDQMVVEAIFERAMRKYAGDLVPKARIRLLEHGLVMRVGQDGAHARHILSVPGRELVEEIRRFAGVRGELLHIRVWLNPVSLGIATW